MEIITQPPQHPEPLLEEGEVQEVLDPQLLTQQQASTVALALISALACWCLSLKEKIAEPPPLSFDAKETHASTKHYTHLLHSHHHQDSQLMPTGQSQPGVALPRHHPTLLPRTHTSPAMQEGSSSPPTREPNPRDLATKFPLSPGGHPNPEHRELPPHARTTHAHVRPIEHSRQEEREGPSRNSPPLPPVYKPHTPVAIPTLLPWRQEHHQEHSSKHQLKRKRRDSAVIDKVADIAAASISSLSQESASVPIVATRPNLSFWQEECVELSTLVGTRISHFDVLLLFFELMKLEIHSQEEEKLARRKEREAQLQYLEQEIKNFKAQAKWLLFSHIGAGVMGIASGALPIIGHMKGDSILNAASSVFSSLQGAKKKEFFENLSKMTFAMSEMQKATGQIYGTSAEGDRTRYNRFADLHKTDQEECTRTLEQLQERFRQTERFLAELLQMRHDVTSQLYR